MNKRTMKKMAKAKQQAAEAAKTAETVVKTAAPAKEVKPTTEKTLLIFYTNYLKILWMIRQIRIFQWITVWFAAG